MSAAADSIAMGRTLSASLYDDRVAVARQRRAIAAFRDFVDHPIALLEPGKFYEILMKPERQLPYMAITDRPKSILKVLAYPAIIISRRELGLFKAIAFRRKSPQ